jgi:hypothetical protein
MAHPFEIASVVYKWRGGKTKCFRVGCARQSIRR